VAIPGRLVSPAEALTHLPQIPLDSELARAVETGKPLLWKDLSPEEPPSGAICLLAPDGPLLALIEVDGPRIRYRRVFPRTAAGPRP